MSTVLVTGGSGFIASHTIVQLLSAGHEVRTTVRSRARVDTVLQMLRNAGAEPSSRLTFFEADLEKDDGWAEAVGGCEYVLHMASPFPQGAPKHEDEVIVPAREGALRALRMARDARVKRVVMTSSFAAIGYGHPPRSTPLDETVWTQLRSDTSAYVKSKTLAERAAWDFIEKEGGGLELAVINPVGVLGPVLGPDYAASIALVKRMLDGQVPACPRLYFGIVDVRDVADVHIRAMESPAAKGQRFVASAGDCLPLIAMARVLRERLGVRAAKVPTRELPDWLVRLAAIWSKTARQAVPELGKVKHLDNGKARRVLGWTPRPNEEVIVATGEGLARLGLL